MRRTSIVAGVAVVLLLSGCNNTLPAPEDRGSSNMYLRENVIVLEDGRTLTCVVYGAPRAGGLSCDWDGAE